MRYILAALSLWMCQPTAAGAEINLYFNVDAWRRDNGAPTYFVSPWVAAPLPAGITSIVIDSPTGLFHGHDNGSSSTPVATLADLVAAITGSWTLTVNKGGPTEKAYTFSVATTLNESDFPDFGIDSPLSGPVAGGIPTFAIHGPHHFLNAAVYCLLREPPYTSIFDLYGWDEAPGIPPFVMPVYSEPWDAGLYRIYMWYSQPLENSFNIGPITDGDGNHLDFTFTAGVTELAETYFEVIPEPQTVTLLAMGITALVARRRALK